jgi:hypothetical protein
MPVTYAMNEAYRFDGFGNFSSKQGNKFYQYDTNKRLTGIFSNAAFTGVSCMILARDIMIITVMSLLMVVAT